KTEVGGVRVGVADMPSVQTAVKDVLAAVQRAVPHARIEGVMVSEMLTDGVEALIGVVNDPVFGPVVAFGLGGILTEILKDVAYRVAPFDRHTALGMVSELRGRAIFEGVRGKPALDTDAVADTLVAVSHLAWLGKDRIVEIDVNPLIVRPRGLGAVAADALIVLK
ncbi:MAG: acetate--CoA ligase family protein, partial [Betaproteobacteria bacterium]|nr:acetate--CoA ligase family protein [Betaproteobacteria bacterium]